LNYEITSDAIFNGHFPSQQAFHLPASGKNQSRAATELASGIVLFQSQTFG